MAASDSPSHSEHRVGTLVVVRPAAGSADNPFETFVRITADGAVGLDLRSFSSQCEPLGQHIDGQVASNTIQINFSSPRDLSGAATIKLLDDIPRPVATQLTVTTAAGRAVTGTRVTAAAQPLRIPAGSMLRAVAEPAAWAAARKKSRRFLLEVMGIACRQGE